MYKNFLDCSKFISKDNHKSIINQIYKIGYPNEPYNYEHLNFNELKEKLKKLNKYILEFKAQLCSSIVQRI